MEQKKKALGKGLEELFSSEVLDFDTFESNIMENTPANRSSSSFFTPFLISNLQKILFLLCFRQA